MRVYGILTLVMALLQRERRVSYWALKQEFGLDEAFIEGLKQELIVAKRVAIDEGGQVLVWTGEVSLPATPAVVQSTLIEAAVTLPPPAQTLTPQAIPTATLERVMHFGLSMLSSGHEPETFSQRYQG